MFAIVVPTLIMTFSAGVPELTFWRFVQGLLLPPIFTVTVAYIGDEWPPARRRRASPASTSPAPASAAFPAASFPAC
jgi:MFS family permease